MRLDSGSPVLPMITDGSQAPLGVALKALPWRSTTLTQVVSFTGSRDAVVVGRLIGVPRLPGRDSSEACAGSISLRRSAAYSFESRISAGILLNFGSP